MPRQEKLAFTRRPAKVLGGAGHRPLRKSDLLPPRFKQRIGEKAKLDKDVHALNRPGTAEPHLPTPPPAPFPEKDSSEEEEEPAPEDLLKRTKFRYKKAQKSRKEAQKEYNRVKDPEDGSLESRIAYAMLEDASTWETRYKREYKDAKRGEDTTDYLGEIRKEEEERFGRPLWRRGGRWPEPGIKEVPGETREETYGRIVMRRGYDPDIPRVPKYQRPYYCGGEGERTRSGRLVSRETEAEGEG
ncbi:hypothetical protein M409DRAFT_28018 [Zasmidium cellare ATCC 36951]|uniref:Uncharacterized protein n=1 Tax=Zasmidium cellare ATCC 36951 TaxID=1080233 RepID=A0A6A6C3E7_ZASCE|nr:uncharacterized protein M409DRAFT_28018 [Zasmidium cellare ATCC 36951]KAF2161624.1 hypothetical protein M409DRAFT_28018 [Zasmidium cellare ATCC 36951]